MIFLKEAHSIIWQHRTRFSRPWKNVSVKMRHESLMYHFFNLFVYRFCGEHTPEDMISTGELSSSCHIKKHTQGNIMLLRTDRSLIVFDALVFTGNVMTLKFLTDASVIGGGFQLKYTAINASLPLQNQTHIFDWPTV